MSNPSLFLQDQDDEFLIYPSPPRSEPFWKKPLFKWGMIIGLVAILCVILIVSLINPFSIRDRDRDDDDDIPRVHGALKETFTLGPLEIGSGEHLMKYFRSVGRPAGDIVIHEFFYDLVDMNNKSIPLENIYNHHVYFLEDKSSLPPLCPISLASSSPDECAQHDSFSNWIVAFGAEGSKTPIIIPSPYARPIRSNSIWSLGVHLIDLWGIASTANTTFNLVYTVVYSKLEPQSSTEELALGKWKAARFWLLGIDEQGMANEFPVPGDGGPGSFYLNTFNQIWNLPNSLIVLAIGHIHIGAVNVSWWDTTENKKTLAIFSKPTYDENNFIIRISRTTPFYHLITGNNYTLETLYDNSRSYDDVMGLMQIFIHVETETTNNNNQQQQQQQQFLKQQPTRVF